jgi:anthranilate synthase component 1
MELHCLTIPADLLTPLAAYLRLQPAGAGLLLESAEQDGRLGRHSFVLLTEPDGISLPVPGTGWVEKLRTAAPAVAPRAGLPLGVGLAGYVGFEALAALEPTLIPPTVNTLDLPTVLMRRVGAAVVFDHHSQTAELQVLCPSGAEGRVRLADLAALLEAPSATPPEVPGRPAAAPVLERKAYEDLVRRSQRLIHEGDVYQVVPSRRVRVSEPPAPLTAYRRLRRTNPSPYAFLLEWPELALVGASPEMLVRVANGQAETLPIAGTAVRTGDEAEDARRASALLADPKERAEHQMLVDLARNDLGRIAPPGGVRVENPLALHRTSRLLHLTTSVKARVRSGLDALDVLAACFPAGTVSGAPKIRAAQRIAELEGDCRGPYGGALVRLGADGTLDSALILRTAVYAGGFAWLQAGAGIVRRSDPAREYFETLHKMSAVATALGVELPGKDDAP